MKSLQEQKEKFNPGQSYSRAEVLKMLSSQSSIAEYIMADMLAAGLFQPQLINKKAYFRINL